MKRERLRHDLLHRLQNVYSDRTLSSEMNLSLTFQAGMEFQSKIFERLRFQFIVVSHGHLFIGIFEKKPLFISICCKVIALDLFRAEVVPTRISKKHDNAMKTSRRVPPLTRQANESSLKTNWFATSLVKKKTDPTTPAKLLRESFPSSLQLTF